MKKGFVVSLVGLAAVVSASACSAPTEEDSPEAVGTATEALTEVYRKEAELEPWNSSYPRVVGSGWGASNDQYVALDWNGGPYFSFYAQSAGWYRIAPRVAGSDCGGYSQAAFYIDAYLSGTRTVAPGWQYPQSDWRWLEAGWHSFGTMLANDYATSTCDRNLWLDYTVIHKY